MLLLVASLALASDPVQACPVDFDYAGQPACVALDWEGERTRVENRCEQAVLLDRAVRTELPLVLPGQTVWVRDLSAFTLGMGGELFRAVAHQKPCATDTRVATTE